jgi:outer membrane protein TolC
MRWVELLLFRRCVYAVVACLLGLSLETGGARAQVKPLSEKEMAETLALAKATVGKAASKTVQRLDLVQLWALAEGRFPGLVAARRNIEAARHTRNEQIFLRLPSADVSGYLSWSPNIKCKTTEEFAAEGKAGQLGGPNHCTETNVAQTLNSSTIQNYLPFYGALVNLGIRITQPLYTFGKLTAAWDLGQTGVDIAAAQSDAARLDHQMNVLRAYFGLKTARAALETVHEGHDQVIKWVKQIDSDVEAGRGSASEIDLMRLKVAESQVELVLIDLERTVDSTLAALRYFAQDATVDIDDSELAVWHDEREPLDHYLDAALRNRPELKVMRATGEGARLFKKLRIAEMLPSFGLLVNFGYGYAGGVQDPNHGFMSRMNFLGVGAGLGMTWGLDLGPKVARLQRAIADVNIFEARKKELLGGGALEIERAHNDVREAQRRLKTAEVAERRARGWLQGIKQSVDVGTAEGRDMHDALRTYFDQHVAVLRAVNDLNVACGALRRVSGLEVIPK